jgi:CRP-like cAMP-binding protein
MRAYLENITNNKIIDKDWELLSGITYPEEFQKGKLLLKEGEKCNSIWFLSKGAVRFYENVNGEYRTTHFFTSPSMFTVYHSLVTGAASEISIETVEEVKLEVLPYKTLSALYNENHAIERIGRIMAEHQFVAEFNRRRMLLNMDALERYEFLEAHQPDVFQHFPLKDIATYLGITPVSLSRLRKYRMLRK